MQTGWFRKVLLLSIHHLLLTKHSSGPKCRQFLVVCHAIIHKLKFGLHSERLVSDVIYNVICLDILVYYHHQLVEYYCEKVFNKTPKVLSMCYTMDSLSLNNKLKRNFKL